VALARPTRCVPLGGRGTLRAMSQHIGIVACTAEGASLCYRTICAEAPALMGPDATPEVTLHMPDFSAYTRCFEREDWAGVGALMLTSAKKLAAVGADFLICPDNTIHQSLRWVLPESPRPWLHIAEAVADEAVQRGFRRLGLLGTRWLVASEVYPEKLTARGLASVLPAPEDGALVHRVIMDELIRGVFSPRATAEVQGVIERLRQAGCDAVILGCTEIPLIIGDANSSLPTLDSTRLLARAALRRASV
jgi:aspartate racemase